MASPRFNTTISERHAALLTAAANRLQTTPTTLANQLLEKGIEEYSGAEFPKESNVEAAVLEVLWRQIVLLNIELKDRPKLNQDRLEQAAKAAAQKILDESAGGR